MNKKIIDREEEIVFTNFSDEDFEGSWNKKIYPLAAGKQYYLPFYLAENFAKNLVQREMNKLAARAVTELRGIDTRIDPRELERKERSVLTNTALRQELMDKCVNIEETGEIETVRAKMVYAKEVPLKTQLRSAELVESGKVSAGDLGSINQPKAEDSNIVDDNATNQE